MKLYCGEAIALLDKINPRFIVTDADPATLSEIIRWCEKHEAILVNAYSTRWLTRADAHPAQKIVAPYRTLIEAFPDEPVVCDPCMGSGSIGEAALLAGREFIGIERIDRWFAIAEARLNAIPLPAAGPH